MLFFFLGIPQRFKCTLRRLLVEKDFSLYIYIHKQKVYIMYLCIHIKHT